MSLSWSLTQTHSWFLSVPSCLNSWDVFWEGVRCGGKRLVHTGEEVLCHPVKLACGRRTRVLWPKHFVFLCRSLRVPGLGLSEAFSMAGFWLGTVLCPEVEWGWGLILQRLGADDRQDKGQLQEGLQEISGNSHGRLQDTSLGQTVGYIFLKLRLNIYQTCCFAL